MRTLTAPTRDARLSEQLSTCGLRFTRQREQVYHVLREQPDHPTAEDMFLRARQQMPDISLATVYSCLDALVEAALVRQVNLDRGACRFCPNMEDHLHFCCEACGGVFDVDLAGAPACLPLPRGGHARQLDIAVRGVCAACAARDRGGFAA